MGCAAGWPDRGRGASGGGLGGGLGGAPSGEADGAGGVASGDGEEALCGVGGHVDAGAHPHHLVCRTPPRQLRSPATHKARPPVPALYY